MPQIIAVVLGPTHDAALEALAALPAGATGAEIRADLFTERPSAAALRAATPVPLIWTVRWGVEGGGFSGSEEERAILLREGLEAGMDLVDVEWRSELWARLRPLGGDKTLASCHALAPRRDVLEAAYGEMRRAAPGGCKLVPEAGCLEETFDVLDWLAGQRDDRLTAFPSGEAGACGRVLAPRLGSRFAYGALNMTTRVVAGQLTVDELYDTYRVTSPGLPRRLFGVTGRNVRHSFSPHLHNAALRSLGIDDLYLPLPAEDFAGLAELLWPPDGGGPLGIPVRGLSVTHPFKTQARTRAAWCAEEVIATGAANTLVADGAKLRAYNTDVAAVVDPLRSLVDLTRSKVAIVGAGGGAAAAAYGMMSAGAQVTLFNRSHKRVAELGDRLRLPYRDLEELGAASIFDVLIHATTLGLDPGDPLPVCEEALYPGRVVFDMAYVPEGTKLVRLARQRGCRVVSGFEMLARQSFGQFERFTGQPAPQSVMRAALRRFTNAGAAASRGGTRV